MSENGFVRVEGLLVTSKVAWRWRARQATALHLLDLKRAGHSPRFTELRIGPGDGARTFRPPHDGSGMGSAAAECVES